MRKYSINKELIDDYVKRETIKDSKLMGIVMLIFLIFMFFFTYSYGVHTLLIPPITILFLIMLAVNYISGLNQHKNMFEYTYFLFTDEAVSTFLDIGKLNLLNQFSVAQVESKFGARVNQTIAFWEIETTTINENEIIIKSSNFNSFTNVGKITIPKEVENYEDIKSEIIKNAAKYKIKNG